jgi:carbonic anhydrase/acetyltransferase-like protein (isoleucine patch superfamily)
MPLYAFEGTKPKVHDTAFVAPTAVLIGNVTLEANASVWYGAVLRGDYCPIVVREGANVQDNAVLHGNERVEIGPGATVAHNCVIHSAVLGAESLVANGCVVLDGVTIGARSLVAAGSVVAANTVIPDGVLAAGSPAVVKRPIEGTAAEFWVKVNPDAYRELAQRHRTGLTEI